MGGLSLPHSFLCIPATPRRLLGGPLSLPAFFSHPRQRFSIGIVDLHVSVSPDIVFVSVPHQRHLHRRSWHPRALKQFQGFFHYQALHRRVPGLATGIAEGKIAEEKTSHAAFLHNISGATNDDGWDAVRFQMPCDQTHGLMTDGSQRHQQGNVHPILSTPTENGRRILLACAALTIGGWHTVESG